MHEASQYESNMFITLTYDDAHLPDQATLDYREYQLFMKRLRKRFPCKKIRFFAVGEYGDLRARPHFHACIFNLDLPDKKFFKKTPKGSLIYTSATLQKLWPFGYSTLCPLTYETAAYAARYCLKKVGGKASKSPDLETIDLETGEVSYRTPEFAHMSLKPGIGSAWLTKYQAEVWPFDRVIIKGQELKPPRYYVRKLKETDPEAHEDLQAAREGRARKYAHDNTDERLLVKEEVLKSKLAFKARRAIK